MAIIYSYPTVTPTTSDLVLGTDVSANGKPTKNFTVQGIIDLVTVSGNSLQAVLDIGNVATGKDINLTNNGFFGEGLTTVGGSTIIGTVGAGFTSFTSTIFTTAAGGAKWENTVLSDFTGIGTQTITVSGAFTGAAVVQTMPSEAGGSATKVVSEKGIIDYLTLKPFTETLYETLESGNKAYNPALAGNPGFDIDMGVTGSTNGNILFGDNKRIKMGDFGVAYPFQMGYGLDSSNTTAAYIENATVTKKMAFESDILHLTSFTSTDNYLTATKDNGVLLYYDDAKTFETIDGGATVTGNLNVTLLATTGNIDNNGYYQDSSNSKGTNGQVLTSTGTGTGTGWVDQLVKYTWKVQTTALAATTVPTDTTVRFLNGDNISITASDGTGNNPSTLDLTFNATGLAKGTGASNQVTYWTTTDTIGGSTTFRWVPGSGLATSGLSVDTQIRSAKYIGASVIGGTLTNSTATWEGAVMSGLTSVTTVNNATANNPNGFFGPLRTNAASTNYAPGVADQAVQLTGAGTLEFNAANSEITVTGANIYKAGAAINLKVILNNDAVIGKVLTGLSVPATGNSIEPDDTILSAFGKLQAQHNTSVNGLRYIGTWDARTTAEGGTIAGNRGNPALADGGGVITTGTNTSVVADQLVDSGKNFTALGVTIGERVYNQAGAFTTVSAVGTTTLTLNEDIFSTSGQTYSVDNNPALNQGEYYVVNFAGTVDLNGNASWAIGDWVIAGAGNTWEKLDQTGVDGTGTIDRIPKWNTVSSLNDSIIIQNATGIKLDTGKDFATQGSGAITSGGILTASAALSLTGGVNLPVGGYGAVNQVLTNAASPGATVNMVWTTPTVGTVTSITAGTGITIGGTAAVPTVAVDYLGTDNFIEATPGVSGNTPNTNDIMVYSESSSGAASNNVKKLLIGNLPFNNYSWKVGDSTATTNAISNTEVVNFVGTEGINTALFNSASYVNGVSIKINRVGSDNAIAGLTAATPIATDNLWFNDISDGNTIRKATISDIVDLGNETLAQVLSNDNVTGGTDIAVSAADDITFTDTSKAIFGTTGDLKIYHDGSNGYIEDVGAGGLTIRANADFAIQSTGTNENFITAATNAFVKLFHDGSERLATTSTGVSVTGVGVFSEDVTANGNYTAGNSKIIYKAQRTGGAVAGDWSYDDATTDMSLGTSTSHSFSLKTANTRALVLDTSQNAEFKGNVEIDGNLTVDGSIIHGGGGAGIFTGSKTINSSTAATAFTLQRLTGTLVFDVWLTSETSVNTCVAKKYTVAHGKGTTPVYNKIIDTGPDGSNDFTVTFVNAGAGGNSVNCSIISNTIAAQAIGYTVQVGHDGTNALTFTAG